MDCGDPFWPKVSHVQPVANKSVGGNLRPQVSHVQTVVDQGSSRPKVRAHCSNVGSATDPFRGKVPKCEHWLDVWAEATSTISSQGFLEGAYMGGAWGHSWLGMREGAWIAAPLPTTKLTLL